MTLEPGDLVFTGTPGKYVPVKETVRGFKMILDGELDLTFMAADQPKEGIEYEVLFVDPFVLVALPDDVGDGPVPVDALRGRALIGQTDNLCQRRVDDNLRACGLEPDYVFRANDNAAVIGMVRANVGMAVMPMPAVAPDYPRLAIPDLDPPVPPPRASIGWRPGRTLSTCNNRTNPTRATPRTSGRSALGAGQPRSRGQTRRPSWRSASTQESTSSANAAFRSAHSAAFTVTARTPVRAPRQAKRARSAARRRRGGLERLRADAA